MSEREKDLANWVDEILGESGHFHKALETLRRSQLHGTDARMAVNEAIPLLESGFDRAPLS